MASSKSKFGQMVRHIRDAIGMTLSRTASQCACSVQHLCDLEKGRRNCTLEMAVKLAYALDHDPEDFVEPLLQEWLDEAGVELVVSVRPKDDADAQ